MKWKKVLVAALLSVALGGCTLFQQLAGNSPVAQDALTSVQIALTAYADVYQPAVIAYGHLPDCPQAALCKDRPTLDKLKAADLAATTAIVTARDVLEGRVTDTGQIAVALTTIASAEAKIAGSGALALVSGKGN